MCGHRKAAVCGVAGGTSCSASSAAGGVTGGADDKTARGAAFLFRIFCATTSLNACSVAHGVSSSIALDKRQ